MSGLARATQATRAYSTAARVRNVVPGARIDMMHVTDTGGSGADSTELSSSLEEASLKAVRVYRTILRDIPKMRQDFTIVESEHYLRGLVRSLFDRHANVRDPKVADMLVFKARQESGEIRNQWKSRHHIYQYITAYNEEMQRKEAVALAESAAAGQSHDEVLDARRLKMIMSWKERGLIPAEIDSWMQYLHWKAEEDAKFENFAVDNQIFTREQLERNDRAKSQCAIM